jgi:ABC-2 type transport system permease protein
MSGHWLSQLRSSTGPARVIALVAKRELTTRARTKSFLISNAIVLALILGGIVAASVFSASDTPPKLGMVGSAATLSGALSASSATTGKPLAVSTVANEAIARSKVASGDLDVALVPHGTGSYTAIVEKELAGELRSIIDSTVRQQAVSSALSAQGVDPVKLARAAEGAKVRSSRSSRQTPTATSARPSPSSQ